jgi:hypothetical protein
LKLKINAIQNKEFKKANENPNNIFENVEVLDKEKANNNADNQIDIIPPKTNLQNIKRKKYFFLNIEFTGIRH